MNGAFQSSVDKRDYIFRSTVKSLPPTFSLIPLLQPVRNQGATQTCAAQVAACIKEYQEKIDIKFNQHFSPQYIFDNRDDKSKNGMTGRDMMKVLLKKGIVPEKEYPFGTTTPITAMLETTASNFKIGGYASVNTINEAKAALIQNGPIYVSFLIYNNSVKPWKPENEYQTPIGGHAMCIVGYTEEGFIIRNSWGPEWANKGYTIFPFTEWGQQWEIFTTIDLDSKDYVVPTVKTNISVSESTTTTEIAKVGNKNSETINSITDVSQIDVKNIKGQCCVIS